MTNTGFLHDRLQGGLWHTTHPERFAAIFESGELKANPNIPNSERWKASRPEHYPFVRCLGGVSLFDFCQFDSETYRVTHPFSNWYSFVPYLKHWGGAVWIEIFRERVAENFISADKLVDLWDQDGNRGHAIMPRIEAAYIGNIPTTAFCSAFIVWAGGNEVRDFSLETLNRNDLGNILEEWRAFC